MNNKHKFNRRYGASGKFASIFIHSKVTLLIIIISLLLGLSALLFTPRTYNPEIVVPTVNVSVERSGSNAAEILNQIVRPLEALMAAIPGVDHTFGMALADKAVVTVQFKVNEDEEKSLVKVYDQINSNLDKIPPGTALPLIQSVSLYDVPFLTITLSSDKYNSIILRDIASRLLEQLRNVPKVGKTWIAGTSPTAIYIWLDANKLSAYQISIQDIKRALIANNVTLDSGKLILDNRESPVRVIANITDVNDVGNIIIVKKNNQPIFLRDVAQIETTSENPDIKSFFGLGGASFKQNIGSLQQAVTIALARQKGSNGIEVANELLDRIKAIEHNALPDGVNLTITRNYGNDANDAVNTLIKHLIISIIAVVILLLIFLGWREASIVIISIPLILSIVLGIGWIAGQTINRITLFALILSLGLLVDDSIVVIENIHRHMLHKPQYNFTRLIVNAVNEIGKPTIVATITVILAILPMAFVTGMMGPFMRPIPFNAPLAMITSLFIAYTVVPYISYRWLKNKSRTITATQLMTSSAKSQSHQKRILETIYSRALNPLIQSQNKRRIFYLSVIGLLIIALMLPLIQFIRPGGVNQSLSWFGVELKMLPDDNVNTFLVEVDMPTGSLLENTAQVTQEIANKLSIDPFVENYQIFLGEPAPEDFAAIVRGDMLRQGSNFAQIRVNLVDKHQRKIGSHAIAQQFYDLLSPVRNDFPEAKIKIFETPPGPPVQSQIMGVLYGPNYALLQNLARNIIANFYPQIYGMINSDNSVTQNIPEYKIIVDRNVASMIGISPASLANEVQTYFAGINIGSAHVPGVREPEKIILKLPAISRTNIADINNLYLLNQQNQSVVLSTIAHIYKSMADKPFFTRDQHTVVYVTGEMMRSSPVFAVTALTHDLNNLPIDNQNNLTVNNLGFKESQPNDLSHYSLFWQGEMRLTLDVFRDLGAAFIVAIILIYFVLVGFYRSFIMPLIIMGAIPLTLIGVFPGHWLVGQPFTATSMIGVIALAGIVVRNSLLLIDFILEHRRMGYSLENAVMEAGKVRISPILLTAFAIIFGSSIMISDPVFGGLAISLIFGAFTSTILTLFIIPLIYYSWWKYQYKQ